MRERFFKLYCSAASKKGREFLADFFTSLDEMRDRFLSVDGPNCFVFFTKILILRGLPH